MSNIGPPVGPPIGPPVGSLFSAGNPAVGGGTFVPASFLVNYTQGTAIPSADQGDGYAYDRALTTETITEYNGNEYLVKSTLEDEIGFDGMRRVENVVTQHIAEMVFGTATVERGVADPLGGNDAIRVTIPGFNSLNVSENIINSDAKTIRNSIWFKFISGALLVDTMTIPSGATAGSGPATTVTDKTEWVRLTATPGVNAGVNYIVGVINVICSSECVFELFAPMSEEVTGQTNQNPSEYVSVGVGTGDELQQDFDGAGWTPGTGWVATSATVATATASTANMSAEALIEDEIVNNRLYAFLYDCTVTGGTFAIDLGGSSGTTRSTTGSYLDVIRADADNAAVAIDALTSFTGTVSNLSIKEIDHGTNVDGVKYFNYENGNTVDGSGVGVVDESNNPGTTISSTINDGVNAWEARTNYADTDDANTQTMDLSAQATGDYTVSCQGSASFTITAGTATATISDATVTEASPGHFDMTVAGTMVITLDSGSLDTDQNGNNIIQCEAGIFASPFIPSPTTTATTRNADDLQYGLENYADEMTVLCEFDLPVDADISGTGQALFQFNGASGVVASLGTANTGEMTLTAIDATPASNTVLITLSGAVTAGRHKVAARFSLTGADCEFYLDGTAHDTTSFAQDRNAMTVTGFRVGATVAGANFLNGNIQQLQIIPAAWTDTQLQSWST